MASPQCPACGDTGWIQDEPEVDGWFCNCVHGEAKRQRDARLIDRILSELLSVDDALAVPPYETLQPGDAAYDHVSALKASGQWVCDATDHNEPSGCSNPACFKFVTRGEARS